MIDIESELFNKLSVAIKTEYPTAYVTGEYVPAPSSFPCVSIVEIDNYPLVSTQDTSSQENHVNLTYEINIYSNKTTGKKAECKAIASLIDSEMLGLGFNRTMLNNILNLNDSTIYRMVGRYRAIVSTNKTIYRRR